MMTTRSSLASLLAIALTGPVCSRTQIQAPPPKPAPPPQDPAALEPGAIYRIMTRAADWQLANPSRHKDWDWTNAAFYSGVMALAEISADPKYAGAMRTTGEKLAWAQGPRTGHADDVAVSDAYLRLYRTERDRRMIAPTLARFDDWTTRAWDEPLTFVRGIVDREWAWCDALFMAPPALVLATEATGDRKYLELMHKLWWKTTDYLYDKEEKLYYRDSRYFEQKTPNGKKVFWSRGNGWVFAGLARVLSVMPDDYPERPRYLALFRDMAEKLRDIQPKDGYWRASLLDPESMVHPETSGTAFFIYGFTWGVNQGLLDRAAYEPAIRRGWQALVKAVHPNGMLGWVQRIGDAPDTTAFDKTEVYGVGAFLLAGSELYKMTLVEKGSKVIVTAKSGLDEPRFDETLEVPLRKIGMAAGDRQVSAGDLVVFDARSGALLASQLYGDRVLFQASFLAGEARRFRIHRVRRAYEPPFASRVFGRAVPERADDFAWENDRVAFRVYGPALQATGEVSSGFDVWSKGVRKLVVDRWYESGDYHKDHGEGLDFYKVGPSRGCGGIGLLSDGVLHASRNYKAARRIANGPVRVAFELDYDTWGPEGLRVKETKRISLDAGHHFNRVETTFTPVDAAAELPVAVGIVKREGGGTLTKAPDHRWLSNWEPAQGDDGQVGCGIVVPSGTRVVEIEGTACGAGPKGRVCAGIGEALIVAKHEPAAPFVHFAGAAWSKGPDFQDADAWAKQVAAVARRTSAPVTVELP